MTVEYFEHGPLMNILASAADEVVLSGEAIDEFLETFKPLSNPAWPASPRAVVGVRTSFPGWPCAHGGRDWFWRTV